MTPTGEHERLRQLHEVKSGWFTLDIPDHSEETLRWVVEEYGYRSFVYEMDEVNNDVSRQIMEACYVFFVKEIGSVWLHEISFDDTPETVSRTVKYHNLLTTAIMQMYDGTDEFDVEEYWALVAKNQPQIDVTKTELDLAQVFMPLSTLVTQEYDSDDEEEQVKLVAKAKSKKHRMAFNNWWAAEKKAKSRKNRAAFKAWWKDEEKKRGSASRTDYQTHFQGQNGLELPLRIHRSTPQSTQHTHDLPFRNRV